MGLGSQVIEFTRLPGSENQLVYWARTGYFYDVKRPVSLTKSSPIHRVRLG